MLPNSFSQLHPDETNHLLLRLQDGQVSPFASAVLSAQRPALLAGREVEAAVLEFPPTSQASFICRMWYIYRLGFCAAIGNMHSMDLFFSQSLPTDSLSTSPCS